MREAVAEEVLNKIRVMTSKAADDLGGQFKGLVNANMTVDGELQVPIDRGEEARMILLKIEKRVRPVKLGKTWGRVWISVALRFPPEHDGGVKERIKYDRVKGQLQVGAFWQSTYKQPRNFLMTRRKLLKSMMENRRRKPTMAIIKYHWNPWNLKPTKV